MSNAGFLDARSRFHAGIEELHHRWGWYLTLGIVLIVLGVIAASAAIYTTLASVIVFGSILVIAGITLCFMSFLTGRWSGFLLSLAAGILSLIIGIDLLRNPLAGAVTLTLLIGSFFLITGIFRAISAIAMQFPNWGWAVLSGIVSIFLGGILLAGWPGIGLWFIGVYVGIDLIVHGFSWCMFAFSVHHLPREFGPEIRERRAA